MTPLIPSTYFGPISYYVLLANNDEVLLETKEHFVKQSYRNRAEIYGANGMLVLTVPLERKSREKTLITDLGIANDEAWQHHQWKSIAAAYRSSPYFEFYEHYFTPLFIEQQTNLFDFNQQLTTLLCKIIGINCKITPTTDFVKTTDEDYRYVFTPKKESPIKLTRYIQVFEDRYGFIPNLSILDLLFNKGPETLGYLKAHKISL